MGRSALLVVLGWIVVAGCAGTFSDMTFGAVKPQAVTEAPPTPPSTLVLGELRVTQPEWEIYRQAFAHGVIGWFQKNGGLSVTTDASAAGSPNSVVLIGTLTEVDQGSAVARTFIGMGAGQAKAGGEFQIRGPDGRMLTQFSARQSYLGGRGFGGAALLDMVDVVGRLGETVAEATKKWLWGEKLD